MLNFENLDKIKFSGVGKYDIPQISAETEYPTGKFIPMNYAATEKEPNEKSVHCFVDDYQFIRYWNKPDKYLPMLQQFREICAPDFSTYTDMPQAMQIYNHYRKHWIAAYWQLHGIKVYPTISWSTPESYEWCFDGEPIASIVAVSSVGTQANEESKKLFLDGYKEMVKRLNPLGIIFYGKVPEECDGNIIHIQPHYREIKRRTRQKWVGEAEAVSREQKDLLQRRQTHPDME